MLVLRLDEYIII